jgi:hypothetical protein
LEIDPGDLIGLTWRPSVRDINPGALARERQNLFSRCGAACCKKGVSLLAEQNDEPSSDVPHVEMPTLLETLPRSDPAVLKAVDDARLGNIHFAVIGRIAALWAYFEAVVDTWLHAFAGLEPSIGVCFTAQMIGPRPRVDAFIAIVRQLGAAAHWNDELEKFAKEVTGLAEQRNRAIHDVWQMDNPKEPQRLEATARRKVRLLKIHVPTKDLIMLADNIDKLCEKFDEEIASKIFNELNA